MGPEQAQRSGELDVYRSTDEEIVAFARQALNTLLDGDWTILDVSAISPDHRRIAAQYLSAREPRSETE